ncbi:MAG TPA: alkaline phosphatase family protein [Propionibacteriaceae bacterium]|nr:alkaline phosphatase family protein [Propionibacteriaceae bacterium]
MTPRRRLALSGAALLAVCSTALAAAPAQASGNQYGHNNATTPIKHVVVIFQENVSFDHYFGTYPVAANVPGEKLQGSGVSAASFTAAPNTPHQVNTLATAGLLAPNNPNTVQPFRLTPAQAVTCDQDHGYTAEQRAYDSGAMDAFVQNTTRDTCSSPQYGTNGLVMGYYDGNTVTGLWNYAQHYAMSDNSYSTVFGPSTPGALNLVSGQTWGAKEFTAAGAPLVTTSSDYTVRFPNAAGVGTVINDPDPVYDDCSNSSHTTTHTLAGMTGQNVGDLMNANGVSWGWFQGGFRPTTPATSTSPAACLSTHKNVAGISSTDYNPHHQPFQYYASTANPHHLAPASVAEIGHAGQANHQYDLSDFTAVVNSPDMPAVSFLKAADYQDGHASYSDPIDEQAFLASEINAIQKSPNWKDTMVVVAYDDSDGWYDHQAATLTNASATTDDAAFCADAAKAGVPVADGQVDKCGPGPRQPLLVISPFAKTNYVDHTQTDQASILRFIEDNWSLGRIGGGSADTRAGSMAGMLHLPNPTAPQVLLDPTTGVVTSVAYVSGQRKN